MTPPSFSGATSGFWRNWRNHYVENEMVEVMDYAFADSPVYVDLFDGEVTISSLELEETFGLVPRLKADVRVEDLSLALLTRALMT